MTGGPHHTSTFSAAMNASYGVPTLPNWRMRVLSKESLPF